MQYQRDEQHAIPVAPSDPSAEIILLPAPHADDETRVAMLTQDHPDEEHNQHDQQQLHAFLAAFQEQLAQAAMQADHLARDQSFALYREGKRANTLRRQRADLSCFMRYLDAAGVPMTATCQRLGTHLAEEPRLWRHVTFGLVLGFRTWQLVTGYAIESVNAHLSTVKTYAALASRAGYLPSEELVHITQIKRVRFSDAEQLDEQRPITRLGTKQADPVLLSAEQLRHLFPTRPQTPQAWRDLLALRLLYDMALRPSEAIACTVGDVHLAEGTLFVYRKKTRLQQRLPLSKGTLLALTNYLPLHREYYKERFGDQYPRLALLVRTRRDADFDDAIERSTTAGPIRAWTTQALHTRVRDLGEQLGIPNLFPYCARHQWAQGVVKAGNDIVTATKFGGWRSDSKMLARYYGDEEIVSSVHLPWE